MSTSRTNKLWVDGGPGVGRRMLRDLSERPATHYTDVSTPGETPAPSTDGQLVRWQSVRLRVQTRMKAGRQQARVQGRTVANGYWLVKPGGQIQAMPKLAAADLTPIASVPGYGWLGVSPAAQRRLQEAVRVSFTGERAPLLLNGGKLTPQRLHDALGLPAAQRPPTGAQNPDFIGARVNLKGYEQSTASAVVSYVDPETITVARLPLDGRSATLVDRFAGTSAYYVVR